MESDPQGATVLAKLRVAGESELGNLANCLATLCGSGDVLCLFGDLGAGKTSFARAFIRALTTPDQEVPSPTFTLVQVYETAELPNSLAIWHADLYRLSDSQEVFELGLDDAFADALLLIEWPQRALEFLPHKRLEIH